MKGVTLLHLLHSLESFFFSMSYVQDMQERHVFIESFKIRVTLQQYIYLCKWHKYKQVA